MASASPQINYSFKILSLQHLHEIHYLINNHYITDNQSIYRITYSFDYLYWYFRDMSESMILGLIYNNKIMGIITAKTIQIIYKNNILKCAYIDFLCLQHQIRNHGLAKLLINEITIKLTDLKYECAYYYTNYYTNDYSIKTNDFVIPINYNKLKNIGFLNIDYTITRLTENPLHLMNKNDVTHICKCLTNFLADYDIKPAFNEKNVAHMFIPKKHIVYSFVKRDNNANATDFITVYCVFYYCMEINKLVSVARLGYYYNRTITLTQLIEFLIDKLKNYDIDQLVFRDDMENANIDITKFSTYSTYYHKFIGVELNTTKNKIAIY